MRSSSDLDDELGFHLEMRAADLAREGLSPAEARRRALDLFGDIERVRASCRVIDRRSEKQMTRTAYFTDLRQDLVYAARQLVSNPGFSMPKASRARASAFPRSVTEAPRAPAVRST